MKVTRRMTQSPEARAAILAQAQAMGISVEDFDTIERGERTMTHTPETLPELVDQLQKKLENKDIALAKRLEWIRKIEAINADLLAALKELTPNIRAIGRSDDLTPIRGEWMMKCLTRCEAAIARAEGN